MTGISGICNIGEKDGKQHSKDHRKNYGNTRLNLTSQDRRKIYKSTIEVMRTKWKHGCHTDSGAGTDSAGDSG